MPTYVNWDKYRGVIRSRNGGWLINKGVFCHKYNLIEDLIGKKSFFQVMILNATGRLVERRLADWFEARQIGMSWPDPRIWCNQIGALGGTTRVSVTAGTMAGVLGADSDAYGGIKTSIKGMRFIQKALLDYKKGTSVEEIIEIECSKYGGKPNIMGYARPIAKGDERVAVMERVTTELGFDIGSHLSLAYKIEEVIFEKFGEKMNINAFTSAFLSDQAFTGEEISKISATLVASGVTACYIDTLSRPPMTFLPLRCDDIEYQGKPRREVPEKNK